MKSRKFLSVLCAVAIMTSATAVTASAMDVSEDPVNLTITEERRIHARSGRSCEGYACIYYLD